MLFSKSEEPTKFQDGIRNLSRKLIDHHPLNGTDFSAPRTTNIRSFNAITGDQIMSHLCLLSPVFKQFMRR